MFIYLLRNRLTGKGYVGQTRRANPYDRINEHSERARSRYKGADGHPLYKSIRKYGWEAFDISILEEVSELAQLSPREAHWIQELGTLAPNGYNLMAYSDHCLNFSEESKHKSSVTHQRAKCSNTPYKGVGHTNYGAIRIHIEKRGVAYTKCGFSSLEEAARYYDKLALYLYGPDAMVNFPADYYTPEELEAHFTEHNKGKKTSRFLGVHWSSDYHCWRATISVQDKNGRPKTTPIGGPRFESDQEVEAAKHRDMAVVHRGLDAPLNFPELRDEYLKLLATDLYSFQAPERLPGDGVKYRRGRFYGEFSYKGKLQWCGVHETEEATREAVLARKRSLGISC